MCPGQQTIFLPSPRHPLVLVIVKILKTSPSTPRHLPPFYTQQRKQISVPSGTRALQRPRIQSSLFESESGRTARIGRGEKRKTPPTEAAASAEERRLEGNACFKKGLYVAAIDAYTQAIALCPDVPIYWTNRALCRRRRNEWTMVEEDCRRAIQLDPKSVKAHCMLGLALLQKTEYAEGVKELERAWELGRDPNTKCYMGDEIWPELKRAKYLQWKHESTKRSRELKKLKQECEAALKEKHFFDVSLKQESVEEIAQTNKNQLEALGRVFKKAAEDDTPTEVPEYLCCKISLDIFRDPVITPSGFTYERSVIMDHIQKVGEFEPITRLPMHECQLVPNLAIREAVSVYLGTHGWAYKPD